MHEPSPPSSDGLPPGALAERLPELLAAGATLIGGCCGTTPEYITALRPVVEAWNRSRPSASSGQ
jgi:hypothetical protein